MKQEIDVVYKPISEVKDKGEVEGGVKMALEGDPWRRLALEYPDLVRIISSLADRSDKIEEEMRKKAPVISYLMMKDPIRVTRQ